MTALAKKLTALTSLCLLLVACAQTGPPLPPSLELPKPPSDLRAIRKGNQVTLSWTEPTLTTDRRSVRYLGPTLICRSTAKEISECGKPVETLPTPLAAASRPAGKSRKKVDSKTPNERPAPQTYTDTLAAAVQSQDPSADLTYAIEVLNRSARGAGISNRVHIPSIVTPEPPSDLAVKLVDDGAMLTWTNSSLKPDSTDLQRSYRVYRHDEGSGKDVVAGEVRIGGPGLVQFTDTTLEWERTYLYRVTSVTVVKRGDGEIQIEGEDSAPVRVIAHDVFPPSVPTGLQAAYSGEDQRRFIDLIWAPVTNSDLAGYNVYRSEAGSAAAHAIVRLNSELVKSPSYRDSAVSSGKNYIYSVSAVDVRGNESEKSEPTSETVP